MSDQQRPPTQAAETVRVLVNGEGKDIPAGMTIRRLVEFLDFGAPRFAVERNKRVVPRTDHDSVTVEDGDVLEIVTFVGGG